MAAEFPTSIPASDILQAQTRERCSALILSKIGRGFHLELGMNPPEYAASFRDAVEEVVSGGIDSQEVALAMVEERIPFTRQLELLGIDLDPGIFYEVVHHPERKPYGVRLEVFKSREGPLANGNNYREGMASLPDHLRPATPFEGINAEVESILAKSFVSLPGGEYRMSAKITGGLMRLEAVCLDMYLGRPRISHVRLAELDELVGMLVAHK